MSLNGGIFLFLLGSLSLEQIHGISVFADELNCFGVARIAEREELDATTTQETVSA